MEIAFGVIIAGVLCLLVSILFTLGRIEKTLKSHDECLSKISTHYEQINMKNSG